MSGCVSYKKIGGYTEVLAVHIDNLQTEMSEFTKARDQLAEARMRNMLRLQQSTLTFEEDKQIDIYIWTAINQEDRLDFFNKIMEASENIIALKSETEKVRLEHERQIMIANSEVDFNENKLRSIKRIMMQLSEKPSIKDEVGFYTDFFKSIRSNLDSAQSQTQQQVDTLTIDF